MAELEAGFAEIEDAAAAAAAAAVFEGGIGVEVVSGREEAVGFERGVEFVLEIAAVVAPAVVAVVAVLAGLVVEVMIALAAATVFERGDVVVEAMAGEPAVAVAAAGATAPFERLAGGVVEVVDIGVVAAAVSTADAGELIGVEEVADGA